MNAERPHSQMERLVAKARDQVLRGCGWLIADEVAQRAGVSPGTVGLWKLTGKIFSVEFEGVERFPSYAFDAGGQPLAGMADVISILHGRSGDSLATWFDSTSRFLAGARPRELIIAHADRVIVAAKNAVEWEQYGG